MASTGRPIAIVRTDWTVLFIVLVILTIGLVMVYSASYGFALMEGDSYEGSPTHFVGRQAMFALAGLGALLAAWRVDYHLYRRYAVWILMLTVSILLPMVFVANRWLLTLPGSQSVQPVELAKYGALVYIAAWLEAKRDVLRDFNLGLVPFALLLGALAGMILLEKDFSTTILFVATATAMFFIAGADLRQILVLFLCGSAAIVLVVGVLGYNYSERVRPWLQQILHGDLSALSDVGLGQPMQSVRALSEGGWFGIGLGHSEQKFVLYAPHTDCIFAIIGEELGFAGAVALLALFGVFVWRGIRVALRAPDTFGMLLAVGIVAWVVFQAALHVAVVTVTTPFTGTVMPFVSYGGSSLMSGLAAIGVLLNISRGGDVSARAIT